MKLSAPRVLGVLAGEDIASETLQAWVGWADVVIAADGGADTLARCGLKANTTIGDLDSISQESRNSQLHLIHDQDQDTTDCDKLLNLAARLGHSEITLCGVEGDLLDHMVGTLQSAARAPISVRLVLRRGLAQVLRGPASVAIQVAPGNRVSFVPIVPCGGVTFTGVHWELHDAVMDPLGLTSLSNRADAPQVNASIETGAAFLFWETTPLP